MTTFRAPVAESTFILADLLKVGDDAGLPGFAELDRDTIRDILGHAATFAEEVLHPLNPVGDAEGCVLGSDGTVRTPPGFALAYRQFADAGWPGAGGPAEYGGQDMPRVLTLAFEEYFWSANCSFTMNASHLGHADLVRSHGTPELCRVYVPPLVSGQWSGAMGLTEPQAGSDLGLVRTRAAEVSAGVYRLSGTKVFTSGGEHDLTENIINFVLARIDGAPPGTGGLSLFLVPKYLPDDAGRPGARNGVRCIGVEHKMGLRGSATCTMAYEQATGFLLGGPGSGLRAMFQLMNRTRVTTAIQALGVSEVAYQNAAAYVRERRQGRAPGGARFPTGEADPLVAQPDVRRILLGIRSFNEAARALTLATALEADRARLAATETARGAAADRVALLTPVLKGMTAEIAFDNAVAAQHLYGGHGYITETGVDQFVRDVRMCAIGEGVTAIQAQDLVRRKIGMRDGAVLESLIAEIEDTIEAAAKAPDSSAAWSVEPVRVSLDHLRRATQCIRAAGPVGAAAGAVHYMHLLGRVALGWMWLRILLARPATAGRLAVARFYLTGLPAETGRRLALIELGADAIMALDDDLF